jgi:TP901 family phage tail tape measure protein
MAQKIGLVAIFDTSQFTRGLSIYTQGLNKANQQTSLVSKAVGFMGNVFQNALGYIARDVIVGGVRAITGFAGSTVEAASDFEDAWTGVMKTVDDAVMVTDDGTRVISDWGKNFRQEIRDLAKEIPVVPEELAAYAEIGGQLGFPSESLLDFTEVIAMMGVTTNISGEQAATSMARFMNVMGTAPEDVHKVGSAIVDLGNNFATTESEILSMAQRLAASGKISNLTEGDVLGIATAFSSVGIQAQAGGTAVQKVLLSMDEAVAEGGSKLETFAAVAGMSSQEFADTWNDNAAQAFNDFVGGLGADTAEANGFLQELELNDSRLKTAFLSLAQNSDILTNAINSGNDAFKDGTALAVEAELRFATYSSQVQILKNIFNDLKITIGNAFLPIIIQLIDRFKEFLSNNQGKIDAFFESVAKFAQNAADWLFKVLDVIMQLSSGELSLTDLLPPGIAEAATEIIGGFQNILNSLSEWWDTYGPSITSKAETLFGTLKENVKPLIDNFIAFRRDALDKIAAWWDANGDKIAVIVERWIAVFQFFADSIPYVWNILEPILGFIMDTILQVGTIMLAVATGDWSLAWETIKEIFSGAWETIKEVFTATAEWVSSWFGETWDGVKETWSENWEMFKEIVSLAWEKIKEFFSTAFENITTSISEWFLGIQEKWNTFWEGIQTKISEIWQAIQDTINEFLTNIFEAMGLDLDEMKERWQAIWDDVVLILETIWTRIYDFLVEKVTVIVDFIDMKITRLSEFLSETWSFISETVSDIWTTITKNITDFVTKIFERVSDKFGKTRDKTKSIFTEIKETISKIWTDIVTSVSDFLTNIIEKIKSFTSPFREAGKAIINGLKDGIMSAAGAVIDAATGVVESALSAAKRLLGIESPSKVFMEIGANTMKGMQKGIQQTGSLPLRAMQSVTQRLITQPISTVSNNVTNTRTTQVNVNANYIGQQPSTSNIYFDVLAALGSVG